MERTTQKILRLLLPKEYANISPAILKGQNMEERNNKLKTDIEKFTSHRQNTHQRQVDLSCLASYALLVQNHHDSLIDDPLASVVEDLFAHKILAEDQKADFEVSLLEIAEGFKIWEELNKKSPIITYTDNQTGDKKKLPLTQELALAYIITAIKADELFEESKCDYSTRLHNFYGNILKIKKLTNCPTGVRNDLVMPLHKKYAGIFILKAWEASLLETCVQFYEKKLLKESPEKQFKIVCQIIREEKSDVLNDFFGDGEDLKQYIIDILKSSIGDPESEANKAQQVMKMVESHVEARQYLPYPCPDSLTPQIQLLNDLITMEKLPSTVQKLFYQCKTFADLKKHQFSDRIRLGRLSEKAMSYIYCLPIGQADGNLVAYAKKIVQEIHALSEDAITSTKVDDYETALDEHICKAKSDTPSFIRDGFAMLRSLPKREPKRHYVVFSKLINTFMEQKNAIVNDESLLKWYNQFVDVEQASEVTEMNDEGIKILNTQTNTVTMTPFSLNRLILQALTICPDAWSDIFKHILTTTVIPLIEKANEGDALHKSVLESSYPPILVHQLKWLADLANHEGLEFGENFFAYHLRWLDLMLAAPKRRPHSILIKIIKKFYPGSITPTLKEGPFFGLLDALSHKEQLNIVCNIVKKTSLIGLVSGFIPEKKRLAFAISLVNQINKIKALGQIVHTLAENDRLEFAEKNRDKIPSYQELADILSLLPDDASYAFALKSKDLIESGVGLYNVMDALPADDRLKLALDQQNKIVNIFGYQNVLKSLPEQDRLVFAQATQKNNINNFGHLSVTLDTLPTDSRPAFALANKHVIINRFDFSSCLKKLNETGRLTFAKKIISIDKMAWSDIAYGMRAIPEADRLELATENQHKIKKFENVRKMLKLLPKADRLVFAAANIREISNFNLLLSSLPINERLQYAEAIQDKIKSDGDLFSVLFKLPEKDKYVFAKANQDKIQDISQLARILFVMPENTRLKFALEHPNRPKNFEDLEHMLRHGKLAPDDSVALAKKLQHKIRNGNELYTILSLLPRHARLAFAEVNRSKILTPSMLEKVSSIISKGSMRSEPPNHHRAIQKIYKDIVFHLNKKDGTWSLGFWGSSYSVQFNQETVPVPECIQKLYVVCQDYNQGRMSEGKAAENMIQILDDELHEDWGMSKETVWEAGRLFTGRSRSSDQIASFEKYKACLASSERYFNSVFKSFGI